MSVYQEFAEVTGIISMNTAKPRRHAGFTLVELLIVIGIIAVLISMLLPMVAKVREQGKQVACMANLRALGSAMLSYAADNDNYLPATSRTGPPANQQPYDWVWWQPNRVSIYQDATVSKSAIARYLNLTAKNAGILRCPSDTSDYRPAPSNNTFGAYPYSYVMNWFIASGSNLTVSGNGYIGTPTLCPTLTKVLNPSQKILMYEEDQLTIDDGDGQIWMGASSAFDPANPQNTTGVGGGIGLLSLRHEWSKAPSAPVPSMPGSMTSAIPNPDARGNVVFCDGHAEFVSRAFVHRPDHAIGTQY
jgi:prepilin-type N-terminal cleavage/methylation domain-containing protein/prepilin-type processing-associated H-X9-DG protein